MGFFGELLHSHGSEAPEAVAPAVAQGAESQDSMVAANETTGEQNPVEGEGVAPAHMDMAGAGPATVDLSGATVSPPETKPESAGGQEGSTESEISAPVESEVGTTTEIAGTDQDINNTAEIEEGVAEDSAEDSSPESVSPGEFSTAVKVDTVSPNESVAINTPPETVEADSTESQEPSSALDQLEQWQKKDAVDSSEVKVDTSGDTAESNASPLASPELSSELAESEPENPVDSEKPDDFAAKLEASAVDEAEAIEAEVNKTLPSINATSSEMVSDPVQAEEKADVTEEKIESSEQTDSTEVDENKSESVPTVEDAPFPELKPDVEPEPVRVDSVAEAVEPVTAETDGDNNEVEPHAVGGADVHINRAEYVTPESSTEETMNEAVEAKTENTVEAIQLSAEQRRTLEDAERVIQDILKKAA
jgi:hypothetical protein